MSKTFQPDSLHPYIMDARLKKATGSGGISNIPIASAVTLGVVKAGDGVSIDTDGTISAGGILSTTEHKTGSKWLDGKDIYRKAISLDETSLSSNTTIEVLDDVTSMSLITNAGLVVKASAEIGFDHALCYMNIVDNKLYMKATSTWNNITDATLIIEYTKVTE
jgi:hypothetical protein